VKTLGIDLSSMPKGTSACCINREPDRAVAAPPLSGCTDESLDALIGEADAIGIDAPLGWPVEFAKAGAAWTAAEWSEDLRDRLRFRKTDLYVQEPPFDPSPLRAWISCGSGPLLLSVNLASGTSQPSHSPEAGDVIRPGGENDLDQGSVAQSRDALGLGPIA
jgi:hypothetical protein